MTQGVSLKPSDAQAGGGILEALNDTDATIKKCRFTLWNYNNPSFTPALFLGVTYGLDDGTDFEQKYRGGESKFLVPSADGKEAVPVDQNVDRTGLPEGCNALIWLSEIVSAGFPEHLIGRDVSVFEGTRVHLNVKPQPKRPGLKNQSDEQKDILVVTKIHTLPGQAVAGQAVAGAGKMTKGKTKTAAQTQTQASPAAAVAASADAVQARAIEVVMEILTSNGGSVPKVAIANKAFKIMQDAKDPLRNDVSKLVFKDEFLSGDDVPWSYDGTTVTL